MGKNGKMKKTEKLARELVAKRNREMSPAERQRKRVQSVSRGIDKMQSKTPRKKGM